MQTFRKRRAGLSATAGLSCLVSSSSYILDSFYSSDYLGSFVWPSFSSSLTESFHSSVAVYAIDGDGKCKEDG